LETSLASWLAHPSAATFSMPLHPPTATAALADPAAVSAWVEAWRAAPEPLREGVQWQERRWAPRGTQRLPFRWEGTGADLLARCSGDRTARSWRLLSTRVDEATAALATQSPMAAPLSAAPGTDLTSAYPQLTGATHLRAQIADAVAGRRSQWLEMPSVDAELAIRAASWFLSHPRSGVRIRQVPLPGMHTKWLSRHRAVVTRLVAAVRADGSEDLGLAPEPVFHDLLVLDPELRGEVVPELPGYPRASRIALADLPEQKLRPRVVIICENAETVQVLPDLSGTGAVAVSGAGYSVPGLLEVPWIASVPILYWGDLDADGFRILDRARHHHERVRSVLMDRSTLEAHRDLVVPGGIRPPATAEELTTAERELYEELAATGDRLEQERIELGFAVAALRRAVDEQSA
jgi:hypothetical protein